MTAPPGIGQQPELQLLQLVRLRPRGCAGRDLHGRHGQVQSTDGQHQPVRQPVLVGLGRDRGFNDSTLVQGGIEADNLSGTAFYQAWTELILAAENPLTLTIHPGDKVTVTVLEKAANTWEMTVKDTTLGTQASRTVVYNSSNGGPSSGASIEAITERPCIQAPCNVVTDLANLAQTNNEIYDPAKLTQAPPARLRCTTPC